MSPVSQTNEWDDEKCQVRVQECLDLSTEPTLGNSLVCGDAIKIEPMLGRDPGIDRAADRSDGWSLHDRASIVDRSSLSRRPKKRGPFHLVPVMAKATLERLS